MVTTIRKVTGGDHPFYEFACLSTDAKPTSLVPENSICHEIDTGKHFYFSNGEWKELPPKGGSGGGGLPADFPAEGSANANKFLGFDANGDYTAKEAPSGGGAEKFVVTLTQDEQTEEWTADKTIAEIVAADEAGKIVVCRVPFEDYNAYAEIPCWFAQEGFAAFEGLVTFDNALIVAAQIFADGGGTEVGVRTTPIHTPTNAPLIVTLTESGGTITGDKTYQEVKEARLAGRPVDLVMTGLLCSSVLDVSVGEVDGESEISVTFIFNGQFASESGAPSDYVGITMN